MHNTNNKITQEKHVYRNPLNMICYSFYLAVFRKSGFAKIIIGGDSLGISVFFSSYWPLEDNFGKLQSFLGVLHHNLCTQVAVYYFRKKSRVSFFI